MPLILVAVARNGACDHVMHGETNGDGHLAFGQFLVDQCSGEAAEGATSILFRRRHTHEPQFGHRRVDLSWKIVFLVPGFCMWGDFLLGETMRAQRVDRFIHVSTDEVYEI